MRMFLNQLQAYNSMFKLLNSYYNITESPDVAVLLTMMSFLEDNTTSDTAVWHDWLKTINKNEKLTKQDAFEGMINFLEIYRGFALSDDVDKIIEKLRSAKNCDDTTIPLVRQWELSLKEALDEPEGTREYMVLTK